MYLFCFYKLPLEKLNQIIINLYHVFASIFKMFSSLENMETCKVQWRNCNIIWINVTSLCLTGIHIRFFNKKYEFFLLNEEKLNINSSHISITKESLTYYRLIFNGRIYTKILYSESSEPKWVNPNGF